MRRGEMGYQKFVGNKFSHLFRDAVAFVAHDDDAFSGELF
jgi:hypothetical protein